MEYRNYNIVREPMFMMNIITAIGRGSVHKSLRGYYSTERDAQKAIDRYEVRKEDSNGETSSSGRDKQIQRRTYNRRKPANNAG